MTSFWTDFDHDPRLPGNAELRASDRDRDRIRDLLGTAYAEGRIDREELDERSDQVARSKRLGDLPPLVNDLVATTPALRPAADLRLEAERRYRADRRESLTYLGPALICWVIWASLLATGRGTVFPWPIFVTMGTAMPALRLWLNPEDHIASRQRALEKKQAKQLPAPGAEHDRDA